MTEDQNKQLLLRKIALWYEPDGIEELRTLVADDYVHHSARGDLDFDQFATQLEGIARAFGEPRYAVVHVLAEADLVAAFVTYEALHKGDFLGVAATGRKVSTVGAYHCRVADGLVQEDWDAWGLLSILLQIQAGSPG